MSDMEFVLTPEGFEDIQRELNELLTIKRPAVVERIREARQMGDLSENSDYDDAKRVQAMLEARVQELRAILSHATVIEETAHDGSIGVGSKVVVKDLEDGSSDEFIIVGPAESSPANGKISNESCVGGALMGRKAGEVVSIETPGGLVKYEIVTVQ